MNHLIDEPTIFYRLGQLIGLAMFVLIGYLIGRVLRNSKSKEKGKD
jgi:hypothetical protein